MQSDADSNATIGGSISNTPRHRTYPAFSWHLPLLAGLSLALFIYALALFTHKLDREEQIRQHTLGSLAAVSSIMNATWERNARLSETLARELGGADGSRIQAILGPYGTAYPDAVFSAYDRQGNSLTPTRPSGGPGVAPVPHTARGLVQQALFGQPGLNFTNVSGFLTLSAAWPVRGGDVGVVLISLPLDTLILNEIKAKARADIALIHADILTSGTFSALSETASTFDNEEASSIAKALVPIVSDNNLPGPVLFNFGRASALAVVAPLTAPNGNVAGAIVTAPLYPVPAASPLLPLAAALGAGLTGFAVTAWGLRKRSERLTYSLAKLASLLRKYKTIQRDTQVALDKKSQPLDRDAARGTRAMESQSSGNEHFLRLFDNAPIGVFQTDRNGYFSRINPAFAQLLGYNSPEQLLSYSSNFTDFFLYTGGLLNPLTAMAEKPDISHIVSLRRQNGKVWHFTLILSHLPSADGEPSDSIEGFLMDRQAEENAVQAKRDSDYTRRQRASLALLLAATCRQTQSYLEPRGNIATAKAAELTQEPNTDAQNLDSLSKRKASVISVNSMLNDIYQIAMTEAESSSPVFMPIEFERFFYSLAQQVLGSMHDRGISLYFEMARELPMHLSGPAPLLRHALERALLAVAAPAQGGWAGVSLTRDPNTPSSHGATRVLFSVTWSRQSQEAVSTKNGRRAVQQAVKTLENAYKTVLELPAAPEVISTSRQENNETLNITEEQEIIRYLLQQMHGDLLESAFTSELRSLCMAITLPWTPESIEVAATSAPQNPAPGELGDTALSTDGQNAAIATATEEDFFFAHGLGNELASLPDASSLELLAMDNPKENQTDFIRESEAPSDQALNILLVDDNLNNRLLFSLFLRNTKHRITEVYDGQQGVEAFQRGRFDVIFLDMEMPLMDGYQATRIIRALETDSGRKPTPIVAMTTYTLPEFKKQCLLTGCSAFLSKPFSKNALLSTLEAFVQLKDGDKGKDA